MRELTRIAAGADGQVEIAIVHLPRGKIDEGPWRLGQLPIFTGGDHSDDSRVVLLEMNGSSHRIGPGEIFFGEGLVDHHHPRMLQIVLCGEAAAGPKWNAQCLEVTGRYLGHTRAHAFARRGFVAGHFDSGTAAALEAQRKPIRQTDRLDSGHACRFGQQALVEISCGGFVVGR